MKLFGILTVGGALLQQGVSLGISLSVSRLFGTEALTAVTVSRNILYYTSFVAKWSADTIATKEAAALQAKNGSMSKADIELILPSFLFSLILTGCLYALWDVIEKIYQNSPSVSLMLAPTLIAIAPLTLHQILLGLLRGHGRGDSVAYVEGFMGPLVRLSALAFGLLVFGISLPLYPWSLSLSIIASCSFAFAFAVRHLSIRPLSALDLRKACVRQYGKTGSLFFLNGLLWMTFRQIDTFCGIPNLTAAEAASYYVFVSCFSILAVIAVPLGATYSAQVAAAFAIQRMDDATKAAQRMSSILAFFSAPALISIALFPEPVAYIFALPDAPALAARLSLAAFTFFSIVYAHHGYLLSFAGNARLESRIYGLSVLVAAPAIAYSSIVGGLTAMTIVMALLMVLIVITRMAYIHRTIGRSDFLPGIVTLFSAGVLGLAMRVIQTHLCGTTPITTTIFLILYICVFFGLQWRSTLLHLTAFRAA